MSLFVVEVVGGVERGFVLGGDDGGVAVVE